MHLAVCLVLMALNFSPTVFANPNLHLDTSLAAEIAQHLQLDPSQLLQPGGPSWSDAFALSRSLKGKGFHRHLELRLERLAAAEGQRGCSVALLQPLPSSIVADPYQLEDLTRPSSRRPASSKHAFSFKLFGPLDLEMPAPACRPTALLLRFNLSSSSSSSLEAAELSVPLHAKYPEPQSFGFQGWHALLTGHAAAEVPWPWVIQDCSASGGTVQAMPPPEPAQQQLQQQSEAVSEQQQQCAACAAEPGSTSGDEGRSSCCSRSGSEQLIWLVPAGNLDHKQLVSWGTLLVTGASAVLLSFKALQVMMSQGSI